MPSLELSKEPFESAICYGYSTDTQIRVLKWGHTLSFSYIWVPRIVGCKSDISPFCLGLIFYISDMSYRVKLSTPCDRKNFHTKIKVFHCCNMGNVLGDNDGSPGCDLFSQFRFVAVEKEKFIDLVAGLCVYVRTFTLLLQCYCPDNEWKENIQR